MFVTRLFIHHIISNNIRLKVAVVALAHLNMLIARPGLGTKARSPRALTVDCPQPCAVCAWREGGTAGAAVRGAWLVRPPTATKLKAMDFQRFKAMKWQ